MCTVTVLKLAHGKSCAGKSASVGASSEANSLARLPSIFWNWRSLSEGSKAASAASAACTWASTVCRSARHQPTLDDLHRRLRARLGLRGIRPCREDRDAVVAREVVHRLIEPGFVAAGRADKCTRVVGHDQ